MSAPHDPGCLVDTTTCTHGGAAMRLDPGDRCPFGNHVVTIVTDPHAVTPPQDKPPSGHGAAFLRGTIASEEPAILARPASLFDLEDAP